MQLQGERERAAQGEEGRKRERKRERACHDYHAISVNPKGQGGGTIDCFPHVRPGEQPLPPFSLPLPLQPQLLSLRAACFVGLWARRAANDANGLNAAQSISSSLRYASSPSVVQ